MFGRDSPEMDNLLLYDVSVTLTAATRGFTATIGPDGDSKRGGDLWCGRQPGHSVSAAGPHYAELDKHRGVTRVTGLRTVGLGRRECNCASR